MGLGVGVAATLSLRGVTSVCKVQSEEEGMEEEEEEERQLLESAVASDAGEQDLGQQ